MRKPYIKKGPAYHASKNHSRQTVLEVGNGTGNGCLISLVNQEDGSIVVHLFAAANVKIHYDTKLPTN